MGTQENNWRPPQIRFQRNFGARNSPETVLKDQTPLFTERTHVCFATHAYHPRTVPRSADEALKRSWKRGIFLFSKPVWPGSTGLPFSSIPAGRFLSLRTVADNQTVRHGVSWYNPDRSPPDSRSAPSVQRGVLLDAQLGAGHVLSAALEVCRKWPNIRPVDHVTATRLNRV